jgi:hypothetical protein
MWMLNTPSCVKHVPSLHNILCKRAYLQFVHAIPIHKIAFVEDDHQETDASSTSSKLDAIYHRKIL